MIIYSVHENGSDGVIVTAETNMTNGLPSVVLVGFAGKSLDESRERIRNALSGSDLPLPRKRITVNMAPSDIPKDGAHFDLAIALSILHAGGMIRPAHYNPVVFGELGLDGSIKPVRGILGKLLIAIRNGHTHFIIPRANLAQASLLSGLTLIVADSLKSLAHELATDPSQSLQSSESFTITNLIAQKPQSYVDFSEIIGQAHAKRALEITAAGAHNILLNGPPGVGKSMLAKALPALLPELDHDEIITATHIHSLVSDNVVDLILTRPFRAPHHSASNVSIVGGGQKPKPGEVSLAHNGVLFLDELPEFSRATIESLRQPLEDGTVTVARAKSTATYPANFILVATQNPCPCGYYGSTRICTCSPQQLQKYQQKLSGPILDRIDMHVTVDTVAHEQLLTHTAHGATSAQIKEKVSRAINKQKERTGVEENGKYTQNAHLTNAQIKRYCSVAPDAKVLLDTAAEKLQLSARVYMKIIKIARTIADLDDSETLQKSHIAEALQYRPQTLK